MWCCVACWPRREGRGGGREPLVPTREIVRACSTDGCKISFDFGNKIQQINPFTDHCLPKRPPHASHNRGGLAMTAEPWPWSVWGPRVPWQDFPLPGLMPLGFQSSASEDPMTPVVWPLVPNTGPDTQATGTGKSSPSESRWLPILTHR